MKKAVILIIGLVLIVTLSCRKENFDREITIPDFDFPKTVVFQDSLSAYQIFDGIPSDLVPTDDFEWLELSSILFTDYAQKQRLVKIPAGSQIVRLSDGSINFPNGTILTKTFYYYHDERDTSLGKRIIETRLLIKESDIWNVATYIWNEPQTDATLQLNGADKQVNWIDEFGNSLSTLYHVPTENECMTCHQSNSAMTPIGPTLLNLNRTVDRNGTLVNQLEHLQSSNLLESFPINQIPSMVDYNDLSANVNDRGRAYLALNCAHCHNPNSWPRAAEREFDFRYETPHQQTGLNFEEDKIKRAIQTGEMPLIGTTMLDNDGIDLLIEFIDQQ